MRIASGARTTADRLLRASLRRRSHHGRGRNRPGTGTEAVVLLKEHMVLCMLQLLCHRVRHMLLRLLAKVRRHRLLLLLWGLRLGRLLGRRHGPTSAIERGSPHRLLLLLHCRMCRHQMLLMLAPSVSGEEAFTRGAMDLIRRGRVGRRWRAGTVAGSRRRPSTTRHAASLVARSVEAKAIEACCARCALLRLLVEVLVVLLMMLELLSAPPFVTIILVQIRRRQAVDASTSISTSTTGIEAERGRTDQAATRRGDALRRRRRLMRRRRTAATVMLSRVCRA